MHDKGPLLIIDQCPLGCVCVITTWPVDKITSEVRLLEWTKWAALNCNLIYNENQSCFARSLFDILNQICYI